VEGALECFFCHGLVESLLLVVAWMENSLEPACTWLCATCFMH
jgi:hypothetical protein